MTTTAATLSLPPQYQPRTEFLVLHRHADDQAWFCSEWNKACTREEAERAVEFGREQDRNTITRWTEDRIAEGIRDTNRDSVIARRRELRQQALTRQYLIVSRDVPAFTPVN